MRASFEATRCNSFVKYLLSGVIVGVFICVLLASNGCGGLDDGGEESSGSGGVGSPSVNVTADNGSSVYITVDSGGNTVGDGNSSTTTIDIVNRLSESEEGDEESVNEACMSCLEEVPESEECDCLDEVGCSFENFPDGVGAGDLLDCESEPPPPAIVS